MAASMVLLSESSEPLFTPITSPEKMCKYKPCHEKTCKCENKDADQLCRKRTADQHLYFRYTDTAIALLPKSETSSLESLKLLLTPIASYLGKDHMCRVIKKSDFYICQKQKVQISCATVQANQPFSLRKHAHAMYCDFFQLQK